jgi:hypothetical protein
LPVTQKPIIVPWFIDDIVARVSHVARKSHVVSQHSGVSVRLSIANYETVIANALRRTLRTDDVAVVPRVSDLSAMVQSTQGKIEFDTMDDSDSDQVIAALGLARGAPVLRRARAARRGTRDRRSLQRPKSWCTPVTISPTKLPRRAGGDARARRAGTTHRRSRRQ